MKIVKLIIPVLLLLLASPVFSQLDDEEYYEQLLRERKINENIVYKPVIGLGFGTMNFYGEVHDPIRNPVIGAPAFKLNVATFLDPKHFFLINFVILNGSVTGNEYAPSDSSKNLNFKSDLFSIGLNIHYDFGHFIKDNKKNFVRPFISLGIENLQFNSKTDYLNKSGIKYNFWNDGTIRDQSQSLGAGNIIYRDFSYETDLKNLNRNGLGSYNQNTFAVPLELGIDFKVSERIHLRVVNSWHYTFTDFIDDVTPKGTMRKGDKLNDWFSFSYISMHLDLFSSDKEIINKKLVQDFANFDYTNLDDEDNDLVKDMMDQCPNTPFGILVDSVGCPLDLDKDGVFDYMDKEPNTPTGEMVDEFGVRLNMEDYAARINSPGITRKEVEAFLLMRKAQNRMKGRASMPIPSKFKSSDGDGDGYISFDELVKSINDFFDMSSDLSTKDIYELQDFFFVQ